MVLAGVMLLLCSAVQTMGAERVIIQERDTLNAITLRFAKPQILAANPSIVPENLEVGSELVIPLVPQATFDELAQQAKEQSTAFEKTKDELAHRKEEHQRISTELQTMTEELGTMQASHERRAYLTTILALLTALSLVALFLVAKQYWHAAHTKDKLKEKLVLVEESHRKLLDERRDVNTMCQRLMLKATGGNISDLNAAWAKLVRDIEAKHGVKIQAPSQDDKVVPIRPKAEEA
jgi:hypothetical protein